MTKRKINLRNVAMIACLAAGIMFIGCNKNTSDDEKGKWIQKKNYPGAETYSAIAFCINGNIYVGEGKDLYEYAPITDTWTEKKNYPGTSMMAYFVLNNKAYVIGKSEVWEYNPENDIWISKADFPSTFPYSSTKYGFSINNKGYVGNLIGQYYQSNSFGYKPEFYEYNAETNTWGLCSNANRPAESGMLSLSTEQYGYTIGGYYCIEPPTQSFYTYCYYNDFYRYDPINDKWIQKASFPMGIAFGVSFCKDGDIYAGLGEKSYYGDDISSIYKYDNENNSWSFAIESPIKGRSAIAVICNGKLYVGLGGSVEFWEYTF